MIKKDDKVTVIKGSDKGKSGTVTRAFPKTNQVIIEGVNMKKKHQKPRRSGEKGQMVSFAAPMNASNVKKV